MLFIQSIVEVELGTRPKKHAQHYSIETKKCASKP